LNSYKKGVILNEDLGSFFLGGLKSEFDEGYSLSVEFNSLIAAADNIRDKYVKFEIDAEIAAELFAKLKIKDTNGNDWTIGASSGSWYKRFPNEKQWISSNPPVGVDCDETFTIDFESIVHTQNTNNAPRSSGLKIEEFISEVEDNSSNKDWLLQEWNKFEEEVRNLEANNASTNLTEIYDYSENSNEVINNEINEDKTVDPSELGLPDNVSSVNDQPFVLDDFFIKPEERDTSDSPITSDQDASNYYLNKPPSE